MGRGPPPTAAKALQVHVSQLRRALGAGNPIVTRPSGYAIEIEPGELDLERFEALVARGGRDAPAEPAAAELLREALALFRGAPLADAPLYGPGARRGRPARGAAWPRSSAASSSTSSSAATASSSLSSRR